MSKFTGLRQVRGRLAFSSVVLVALSGIGACGVPEGSSAVITPTPSAVSAVPVTAVVPVTAASTDGPAVIAPGVEIGDAMVLERGGEPTVRTR